MEGILPLVQGHADAGVAKTPGFHGDDNLEADVSQLIAPICTPYALHPMSQISAY